MKLKEFDKMMKDSFGDRVISIPSKKDNIEVYFESKSSAELVATFNDEEIYMACVPVLEKLAKEHRMILTETIK
tara:strand:- start:211 stop:432 length:222 start_codon:yes stop_codon:yes gene_type:complete